MKKKMRVYAGHLFLSGVGYVRAIVAGTRREVADATGVSFIGVRRTWVETHNASEVQAALREPGSVFRVKTLYGIPAEAGLATEFEKLDLR